MPLNSSGIKPVDYFVMIAAALLPLIFGFKGKISRAAGVIMCIGFVAYTWFLLMSFH